MRCRILACASIFRGIRDDSSLLAFRYFKKVWNKFAPPLKEIILAGRILPRSIAHSIF